MPYDCHCEALITIAISQPWMKLSNMMQDGRTRTGQRRNLCLSLSCTVLNAKSKSGPQTGCLC